MYQNNTYDDDYYYTYSYDDYDSSYTDAAAGIASGFVIIMSIIGVCLSVLLIVSFWKMFKKAGKSGWESIIPIYNTWVLYEISGYPGWYSLISLIPFVGWAAAIVFAILCAISLSKKFGKSGSFALVLLFFPVIGYPMLGLGNAAYDPSQGENKNNSNPASSPNQTQNQPYNQPSYQNSNPVNQTFSQNPNPSPTPNPSSVQEAEVVSPASSQSIKNQAPIASDSTPSTQEPVTPNSSSNTSMKFCPNCGTSLPADSAFCPNCGQKLV